MLAFYICVTGFESPCLEWVTLEAMDEDDAKVTRSFSH